MVNALMDFFFRNTPEVQQAREEGFQIAESYFKTATRNFYRQVKKGLIKDMASISTISNHKCNCEFCWTNEPEKV